MSDHLLALGLFVFGIDGLSHQELSRQASARFAQSDRYGARPASQHLGPGEETITITGMLVPEIAGTYSDIQTLRDMMAVGDSLPLITGDGDVLGDYRIDNVDDNWRNLIKGGRGRQVDFAVDLTRTDG